MFRFSIPKCANFIKNNNTKKIAKNRRNYSCYINEMNYAPMFSFSLYSKYLSSLLLYLFKCVTIEENVSGKNWNITTIPMIIKTTI